MVEIGRVIEHSIDHDEQALTAIRAFFNSSNSVTQQEFTSFTERFLEDSAGLVALSWAPQVSLSDLPAFEQAMREQGQGDYQVYDPNEHLERQPVYQRGLYYPVGYIAPLGANQAALGFDLGSDAARLEAIIKARDLDRPVATSVVDLVQTNTAAPGILVMLPIYQSGGSLETVQDRRSRLRGVAIGTYEVNGLVQSALATINRNDIDLYLFDVTFSKQPRFLGYYPSISGSQQVASGEILDLNDLEKGVYSTHALNVGQRDWLIVGRPGALYAAGGNGWLVLLSVTIGFLLIVGFLIYVRSRQKAEAILVHSEAEFRALANSSLAGIVRGNLDGEISYANDALAHIFGYASGRDLLHMNIRSFTSHPERFVDWNKTLETVGEVRNQEMVITTQNGENRHALLSAALYDGVVSATWVDITERIQSEKDLRMLSSTVTQMADTVLVTDINGAIEYVNPAFELLTGYTAEEVLGQTPRILKSGEHALAYYEKLWETILGGEVFQSEIVNRKKTGDLYYEDKTITPIRDAQGKITHFVATGKNITERRMMERELRRREAEYRLISENTGDVIWLLDLATGRFTYVSPSVQKLRGFSPEEVLNQTIDQVLTPESLQKIMALLPARLELYNGGQVDVAYSDELDQIAKDGTVVYTEVSSSFVLNENGALQVVGISRNISERKQAALLEETVYRIAEAAQASESLQDLYPQLHRLIANVMYAENFFIALHHPETNEIQFAYSVDQMDEWNSTPYPVGKGLTECVLRTGQSLLCDDKMKAQLMQQGDYIPVGASCKIWLGAPLVVGGQTIGVMAVQHYSDPLIFGKREQHILEYVSTQVAAAIDRKQREEAVRQIERRNSALIEYAPDGIVLLDSNGKFLFGSPSAYRLLGVPLENALGQPSLQWVHPDDVAELEARFGQLLADPAQLFSIQYRTQPIDGSYLWMEGTFRNLMSEPSVKAVVHNFRDITESKLASQLLQESRTNLETAQAIAHLGSWELNFETGQGFWSKEMFHLFERDPQQGTPVFSEYMELVHPEDRLVLLDAHYRSMETKELVKVIYRSNAQCMTERYFAASISPVTNAQGQVERMSGTVLDITELKRAQLELEALNRELEQRVEERTAQVRKSEATYRALFENSNDAIFLLPAEGDDYRANTQALELIGYTLDEYRALAKTSDNPFAPLDQQQQATERLAALQRGDRIPLYERTYIRKNGQRIETETNLSAVRDADGNIIMIQSVVRDITERKKAEDALRESRDNLETALMALEKASRMKDEFLASMSHELRTPLTGILGLSEVLQLSTYGVLSDKQLRAVKTIESSGRHLLELINDILDLSKIEAGKLDLQIAPCEVSEICQASMQLVKGMAHQKMQKVSFAMNPARIEIQADGRRLKQMLVNLLSNAVKFTPESGQLGLEVQGSEEENLVRFVVWDKGIGINPGDLSKLFRPFVQLDSSLSRQYSGTGLGLSLVKRMAELHGGRIEVESVPGEGSRFTILMQWKDTAEADGPDISPPHRDDLKQLQIRALNQMLVIEDNPLDAEHVTRYLQDMGLKHVVQVEMNGAVEKAAALCPGVIFLDLYLQDGFGLDLLAQLKADARTRHIPVVITSIEERRKEAFALGAVGYLVKPYVLDDLRTELAKVAKVLPADETVMLVSQPASSPLVLITDDNQIILSLLSDFLAANGYRVAVAHSGFDLLEQAAKLHPDIMLVDIQMAGMDGLETMRRVRGHVDVEVARTPMIAVTALAMTGDREKCLQAGANDYISKPVVLTQLLERISVLLKLKEIQS